MKKQPNILVVGSFVMDLIASAPRVPSMGETVIGNSFLTAPGGKGANQALQCARLGAKVTMVGCVGRDAFGEEILQTLERDGVDISRVKRTGDAPTGVGNIQLQITDRSTENRILVVPGANHCLHAQDVQWLREEIRRFDMVMLQLEIPLETNLAVAEIAHQAGVPVMLNPAPAAPLPHRLLSCVTYLSPNEHEAAMLSGIKPDRKHLADGLHSLKGRSGANILITLGTDGAAYLGCDGALCRTDCVHMDKVQDPTAAGDSFVAAFCVGTAQGLPAQQAMDFAAHTAAITVSRMGAMPSLPYLAEVKSLLQARGYTDFDMNLLFEERGNTLADGQEQGNH